MAKKQAASNGFNPVKTGTDPRKGASSNGDAGRGNWITLKSGEMARVTVLVEPEEIVNVEQCAIWLDEGNSPVWVYTGPEDPSHDMDIKRTYRAYLPVLNDAGEQAVFSMSKTVHGQILDVAESVGELAGCVITIKRTGSGLTTRYSILPTGKRMDISKQPEMDVVSLLGPITPEGVRQLIAEKLGKPDYDAVLDSYNGKSRTTNAVKENDTKARNGGKAKNSKPVFSDDDDEDEDLELT